MKKTYLQPATETLYVGLTQMMALSMKDDTQKASATPDGEVMETKESIFEENPWEY